MREEQPKEVESLPSMPCGVSTQEREDLEEDGYEYAWSFNRSDKQQWQDACKKVELGQKNEDWEYILVNGFNEHEKKHDVSYLFKKKRQQRLEWDQGQGY